MNKTILFCAVVFFVALVNVGFSLRSHAISMEENRKAISAEVFSLEGEFREKSGLRKKDPKAITKSFEKIVNEMNFVSAGSGLTMTLVFPPTNSKSGIESFFKSTDFRGVQGMSLDIRVVKVGPVADVRTALDAIYLLEHQTDFKICEISQDTQEIRVRGTLFGI